MNDTSRHKRSVLTIIVFAGLITGLLDGIAAIIQYTINGGRNPSVVFKFIASGVFGKDAFTGGSAMIVWGVLFHFLIALLFSAFFFLLYPKIKWMGKNKIITGALYGIFVWAVMNLLVVPLSKTSVLFPTNAGKAIIAALVLIACIGIPLSLIAGKYYRAP